MVNRGFLPNAIGEATNRKSFFLGSKNWAISRLAKVYVVQDSLEEQNRIWECEYVLPGFEDDGLPLCFVNNSVPIILVLDSQALLMI